MSVYFVEGRPRQGKTCLAVYKAWRSLQRGRRVATNFDVYDWRTDERGWPVDPKTYGRPWSIKLDSFDDLLSVEPDTDVVLDEGDEWFHTSAWQTVTDGERRFFKQHGKGGVNLYLVGPSVDEANTYMRRLIHRVITVRKALQWPLTTPEHVLPEWILCRITERNPGLSGRESSKAAMSHWQRFDASTFRLYDTAAMIGDRTGADAGRGSGRAYRSVPLHRLAPDAPEQVGSRLVRIDGPMPRYERLPDLPDDGPPVPHLDQWLELCEERRRQSQQRRDRQRGGVVRQLVTERGRQQQGGDSGTSDLPAAPTGAWEL